MTKKTSRSSPVKAFVIIRLIRIFAFLPLSISRLMTRLMAWIMYFTYSRSRKVTEINLRLCFPQLNEVARDQLTRKSLLASAQLMAETAKVWVRPSSEVLSMINLIDGEEFISKLINDPEKGTLIISPHLGNWELLYTYLASNFKTSALYRPPKIAELEAIIVSGREQAGGKVIKTSQMEVRKMLRNLKKAESLFILPDQQPQQGSGVLAPFYGYPAYTMTLLQGLTKRTGAPIVMATCIRTTTGFKLAFSPVDIEPSLSNVAFAEQLNLHLQQQIDKTPEQYEWAYKRFKPSSDAEIDYYH